MRTRRRIIKCIQPQDWFAAINLKDACFYVSILLRHRPFLRFAFEGRAWQYRILPFGLCLSPRVFTKVVEGALTPLQEVGVRILNYLDDWLILAQSREQLGDPRDLVLRHLSQLGLRVNWEKSKLSPVQRITFLELDSVSMTARLTEERAQAVLNCLSSFRGRNVVPLKQFQRLLWHMASAAAVTPLGLLHMRPLQHWLHSRVPRWAWRRGTLRVGITQQCCRSLRHCASSGRTRSRSCWSRPIGPPGPGFQNSTSLAHSYEEGTPLSGAWHHRAPASRSMEPPCVAPGRDAADLSGLPPAVVETIIQARAPSTRQTYALKWSLFATWCSSRREDPRRYTIGVVLSFQEERLERRLSPSTLKVYVAAIAAHHDAVAGPWENMISSWGSWRGPGGWIPPGLPLCPLGTSLSSWLDFRGAPLSRWTQSSWSSCLLRQRSWPRSLPSNGWGPPGVFGKRRVPCVQAGLLSRCLETPAWIRAQGSHHAVTDR